MRQVTRLDPASAHQTQVLTTHDDWAATEVAQRTFDRWRIENFFRYMRPISPRRPRLVRKAPTTSPERAQPGQGEGKSGDPESQGPAG